MFHTDGQTQKDANNRFSQFLELALQNKVTQAARVRTVSGPSAAWRSWKTAEVGFDATDVKKKKLERWDKRRVPRIHAVIS